MRLVQTPLPTFCLIIEFNEKNECRDAYVVHVGEEYIRRVLKRVRELSVTDDSLKLNKYTLDLTWGDQDRLPQLSGHSLAGALEHHVAHSMEDYLRQKMSLVKAVGYEDAAAKLNLHFRKPADWEGDPKDLIVDFTLGILPYLEVKYGSMIDTRFGVPTREPLIEFPSGSQFFLKPKDPTGDGRLKFRASNVQREFILPAKVYAPRELAHIVELQKVRFRFVAPFVDFTFGMAPGAIALKYRIPSIDEAYSIHDMKYLADLILFLHAAGEADDDIVVEVYFENLILGSAKVDATMQPAQPFVEWANLVRDIWLTARHFELERTISVRVAELTKFEDPLHVLAALTGQKQARVRLLINIESKIKNPDLPWCCPIVVQITIGEYTFQVASAAIGKPVLRRKRGNRFYKMVTSDIRLFRSFVYRAPEQPEWTAEQLKMAVAKHYDKTTNVLLLK